MSLVTRGMGLGLHLPTGGLGSGVSGVVSPAAGIPEFVQAYLGEGFRFEKGDGLYFPHEEYSEFNGFHVEPLVQTDVEHDLLAENVFDGQKSHKAWMKAIKTGGDNHRAYATVQLQNAGFDRGFSPYCLMDFWAYVDVDMFDEADKDWVSLATFTSYEDNTWPRSVLLNLDRDYGLHIQHRNVNTDAFPVYGDPRFTFPRSQWNRITILTDYTFAPQKPVLVTWIDGVERIRTEFTDRLSGLEEEANDYNYYGGMVQFHAGLYAPPLLTSGTMYNDNLQICRLVSVGGGAWVDKPTNIYEKWAQDEEESLLAFCAAFIEVNNE